MARKPTLVREWRVSIIREKIQYLGRVSGARQGDGHRQGDGAGGVSR
jgi:hypothetical protein